VHTDEAVAAVFPAWLPLNNAIMRSGDDAEARAAAAAQLPGVYSAAGVDAWALWLPSNATSFDAPDEVKRIGTLTRDTTTLVMQATLTPELRIQDGVVGASIAAATRAAGDEEVPVDELGEPEPAQGLSAWVMLQNNVAVAGTWSFLHERDCGIYTVGTMPGWRRRGLARRLVEHALADAQRRGARTASLQSTPMAQQLYRSLGFQPVGRYEEWALQAA
jgi:ribosomal protein S18 acetylase RimI-like enzyme